MRKVSLLALLLVSLFVVAGTTMAAPNHGGRPLSATLLGANEAPGPGDPDGTGNAEFRLNPGQGEICYDITVADIALPATGAHIHRGAAGVAGPVVVPLTPPDASGHSSGCASVDRELVLDILHNPSNFYANIHTSTYPAGAIRDQLNRGR